MKNILGIFRKKNESGQGIMEYIIITGLVGIFCIVSMKKFGEVIDKRTQHIKSKIVETINK